LTIRIAEGGTIDLRTLVRDRGLEQITDAGAIDRAVDAIIAANPDKAEQAKSKPGMLGWFVGQVMKSTGGKANPQAVSDALKRRLGI
jgi:aspartyl-tRNA(Asn)/glutamyl-tRNA(Gln) amidotransferase subunit B